MEEGRILFIDDELCPGQKEPNAKYMWFYVAALHDAGFVVTETQGPDEALEELSADPKRFDLVILDIMMPPGEKYRSNKKSLNGLRTGILLAETLNKQWPSMPVLVLTNVLNPAEVNKLNAMPNVERVLSKPYCTPFQVLEEIKKIGR